MKQIYNPDVEANSTHVEKNTPGIFSLALAAGRRFRVMLAVLLCLSILQFVSVEGFAQDCATSGNHSQTKSENTYYPGKQASVPAGSTSVQLDKVPSGYGSTSISAGDIIFIIQMQGANINVPANVASTLYGGNKSGQESGFITTNLMAGNMEFAVATNSVSRFSGGTLNLQSPLSYSYANSVFGTTGKYTYQVIVVPSYYDITLNPASGTISTPNWNGNVGGVTVITAVNQLNFNGKTIDAVGAGFRGGGGRKLGGASGHDQLDAYTMSTVNANGSKGEGIAGTPRYINFNNSLVDNIDEGYPGGSYARGGAGNAGGGGTDSNPDNNNQNSGGGGGGNGGKGGLGGNGWYSFGVTGGYGGFYFATTDPSLVTYYSPSRLIMGGGGGAGSTNDGTGNSANDGFESSGATGGGLVIVNALTFTGTGTIDVSGDDASNNVLIDGSGGGGAGGSILIYANSGQSGITAIANGGNGGTNTPKNKSATQHGPGGGGGGGVIFSNAALNAASSVVNGTAGLSIGTLSTDNYGAKDGKPGVLTTTFPFSQLPPNMEICQIQVLPVTITNFSASYISSNNVKVAWSTSSEINADYYVVERSTNSEDFIPVGQVNASESANPVHNYSLNDQLSNVNSNIIYYRLRIVDKSGKFSYSKIVPVRLDQPANNFSIYPNPVDNYVTLNLFSDKPGMGVLRVIDNSGRQILTKSISVYNGNNSIAVDQLGYLPKGVYMVQVLLNNNLYNQKLLKK